MATLVLRGLESKPKLNGRTVQLVQYHHDRGRWEVELEGELPPSDLFQIEWSDDWWEPLDGDSESFRMRNEPGPTFHEELEKKLTKLKLLESTAKISVVDCNGKSVCVFDADGQVLRELRQKHIPRRTDTPSEVCQRSFPLQFQRKAPEGRTLAVRPSCLRLREDSSTGSLRKRKVEMSVGVLHRKPELDGQPGTLGPFQVHAHCWQVLPDARSLWDVKVDGSAAPVLLASAQIRDEVSGDPLTDPVHIRMWQKAQQERALYASVAFQKGQIIIEDEPVITGDKLDMVKLLQQYKKLPSGVQEQVNQLRQGPDFLHLGPSVSKPLKKEDLLKNSQDAGIQRMMDTYWALMRTPLLWLLAFPETEENVDEGLTICHGKNAASFFRYRLGLGLHRIRIWGGNIVFAFIQSVHGGCRPCFRKPMEPLKAEHNNSRSNICRLTLQVNQKDPADSGWTRLDNV
ncbi:plbB [Symbiodinium natans]|uniref:PlbB protein n=1 Tax=Symbiodinium natans TaxID=878477 RepID=A0A812NYA1_9DINO|nr:plbB [Symbiodinium natans]